MNTLEKRATLSLSSLLSLRMLGLFMILPIFSPYAQHMAGSTPFLIGTALGIYGLTQALGQLLFGSLSDYFPRKHVIAAGFFIFVIGSVIATHTHTIYQVIAGRAIQGAGAVGSVIVALLSDLTRQEQRSKAIAIMGITIGCTFFLAMLIGPVLSHWIGLTGIFWMTAILGVMAIGVTYLIVPQPPKLETSSRNTALLPRLKQLITMPSLINLDIGIFCLHTVLTANFVVLPLILHQLLRSQYPDWSIYLPTMTIAIFLTFAYLGRAEKTKCVMPFFLMAIALLSFCQLILGFSGHHLWLFATSLTLFFTAFNILEAKLPSLVSQYAPPALKGTAVGIFSTFQYSGIFVGGLLGGWLYGYAGISAVLASTATITLFWLLFSFILYQKSFKKHESTPKVL